MLLGHSGCGKSTLLYLVAGLEEATSGEMSSFGQSITDPAPDRSLIFQETSLFPWLSVWQNVTFGLSLGSISDKERKEIATEVLTKVGLRDGAEGAADGRTLRCA